MRVLAWLIGLPVAVIAIVFAVSNRQTTTVELWPLPFTFSLPLFLIVLVPFMVGLLAGAVILWFSQGRRRSAARADRRRLRALERENEQLKAKAATLVEPGRDAAGREVIVAPASSTLEHPSTEAPPSSARPLN
ncbi:lipopolysaccharide assembly protein LapA domain-containing protein [Telmatospirillum sp. J64-1]|uniref:lipopolysaccharide assembly protein LapA domain-containing protein n=1 Tax=Telmatospirillum sp. J64-1 TaxID=2502183 RepID=UPI00163D61F2|nr:lipopolysaccharide assembly protein LapA domain-containing protein [Telmatospirillum sp. J64-1]